ncbi:MAG TPA: hypothetical protein VMN03_13730 [Burkholderiales bacterium]|nr:hypothetical protein [Burkholderiales bacterium]
MHQQRATAVLVVTAWIVAAGCLEERSGRDLPPAAPSSVPASTSAPEPNSSSGPGTVPAPDPDRNKPRGNTPPGMDRSGGGPADGAIRDPTGAATGTPDRR